MKQVALGGSGMTVPAIIVGCMRLGELDGQTLGHFIHTALDSGANGAGASWRMRATRS